MKRVNITLFGIPFIGVEAGSSSNEQSKSIGEYAKETVAAARSTVHTAAQKLAEATNEGDPSHVD